MVAQKDEAERPPEGEPFSDSPRSSPLSTEIREVLAELREEVSALRDEVQSLRRNKAPDGPDPLLPREEAAETLGVSVRTLDNMEEAGEIQAVRIRGRVLYAPETLDAYIRARAGGGSR
jgi:excisionase family DNA binding protein